MPSKEDSFADLTSLSVLIAGPEGTSYAAGVFHLDLKIPTTYPQSPPVAHFRTKIFHPNVDPATGAVCVDTLKRDWKAELTLCDVLVTITCLLVCPNPASALNAEAGQLMEEDFKEFGRKAQLWARMHATVPAHLKTAVEEARNRGEVDRIKDGKQRPGQGKKRDARVLVQEVDVENVEEQNSTHADMSPPKSNPTLLAKPEDHEAVGLGLQIGMDSSVMGTDTPTQPPPRWRRKVHAFTTSAPLEGAESLVAPPLSPDSSTPTSQRTQLLHVDAPHLHGAKRLRVTSSGMTPTRQFAHHVVETGSSTSGTASEFPSWLDWTEASPTLLEEHRSAKQERETSEYRRLKAAGFCIKRYNSGSFGPKRGIERL